MRDFSKVKRIVIKVGTNLLSTETKIDENRIKNIASQISKLKNKGYQVVLVTSGAIGMGAKELNIKQSVKDIALRQALASIGQPVLMSTYRKYFQENDIICSQVLITRNELDNRKTYVNLRNSIFSLLDLGIVPILNENDSISTAEIGSAFGDNDRMSALVASKIDAELLVILTDIDGLYNDNPKTSKNAKLITEIDKIDDTIMSYAKGAGSTFATGGMKTKLLAAQIASIAGCDCVIASGLDENSLEKIVNNETYGTLIHSNERKSQKTRWIINSSTKGSILVDDGAIKALKNKKSLLPSGIIEIKGAFLAGDVIEICDKNNLVFAKAVPYYDSTDILAISGHNSSDIDKLLGPGKKTVVFRPEDLVFTSERDE